LSEKWSAARTAHKQHALPYSVTATPTPQFCSLKMHTDNRQTPHRDT
jgi:hypothetical protein